MRSSRSGRKQQPIGLTQFRAKTGSSHKPKQATGSMDKILEAICSYGIEDAVQFLNKQRLFSSHHGRPWTQISLIKFAREYEERARFLGLKLKL